MEYFQEDSRHCLQPIPGGGEPVGGGIQVMYDRRGTFLTGVAEGRGTVQGVPGGDGRWIYGRAHEDTTWVRVR